MSDFDNLAADLNKSKCQSTLLLAIKAGKKAVNSGLNSSAIIEQHSNLLAEKETLKHQSKAQTNGIDITKSRQDYLVEAANFNWSIWKKRIPQSLGMYQK